MNNKGFAITTILYGVLILFMLLLTSMLAILGSYRDNLDKLIESNNGARDIVSAVSDRFMVYVDHYYYNNSTGSYGRSDVDLIVGRGTSFIPEVINTYNGGTYVAYEYYKYYYSRPDSTPDYEYIGDKLLGDSFEVTQDMIVNIYYCASGETCPDV